MTTQEEILVDHQRMWHSFCRLTVIAIGVVIVVVAVVMVILTH